jgi:flagellar biosynthesis GTPase FlhF
MALKTKISKEAFEKLPDHFKAEYKLVGDSYRLDADRTDDDEETPGEKKLREAKEHEKEARKAAEKEARELRERLAESETEDARKRGDVKAVEESWKTKHEAALATVNQRIEAIRTRTAQKLVTAEAQQVASKLFGKHSALGLPHILARLEVEYDEHDEPSIRVKDSTGKKSAATIDDLTKEFSTNADFSGIIIASGASGGGPAPNGGPVGHVPGTPSKPAKLLSQMTESELSAHVAQRRAEKGVEVEAE